MARNVYAFIVAVLLVCLIAGIIFLRAAAKASAFNRITGSHVTVWDALTLDLRVQAPPLPPSRN